MKAYKIHLIRHAMTEENLDGKYIGQTDVPGIRIRAQANQRHHR